jgi:hypothetical protein
VPQVPLLLQPVGFPVPQLSHPIYFKLNKMNNKKINEDDNPAADVIQLFAFHFRNNFTIKRG